MFGRVYYPGRADFYIKVRSILEKEWAIINNIAEVESLILEMEEDYIFIESEKNEEGMKAKLLEFLSQYRSR